MRSDQYGASRRDIFYSHYCERQFSRAARIAFDGAIDPEHTDWVDLFTIALYFWTQDSERFAGLADGELDAARRKYCEEYIQREFYPFTWADGAWSRENTDRAYTEALKRIEEYERCRA